MEKGRSGRGRFALAGGMALAGLAVILILAVQRLPGARAANAGGVAPAEGMEIYVSGLNAEWADWSWADHKIPDPAMKFDGKPVIQFTPAGFKGIYLHHGTFSTEGYAALSFSVRAAGDGSQKINVSAADAAMKFLPAIPISSAALPTTRFTRIEIPLEKLNATHASISGICFQDASGGAQPVVYLADIRLVKGNGPQPILPPVVLTLTVNTDQPLGSINPNIYGLAQPGPEHYAQLHIPLTRWGGNPATRYNWELGNAWNAARDWRFLNGSYSNSAPMDRLPSGVADKAFATAKAAGSDMLITIPTMGWVARDADPNNGSLSVPAQGGPPAAPNSEAILGYDPAANRLRVSQKSLPRKGKAFADPPDLKDDVVYQDEWVAHLARKFGKANAGGVRFYAMDNEPELWSSTHTDMHPVQPDYAELLKRFLDYATAVKDVDSGAQITGPTTWGWTGYFYSPRDQGADNYATHADRKAHGDTPFLPWFLQQVAAHDRQAGRRTLDYLDIHFYPQAGGIYEGKSDLASNALRLRSTAALYDPNYQDESWIGDKVELIPRMKRWIAQNYPGTKLALTEWNWGADTTLNGGIAVAEVLGILGREQVDMAAYWAVPGVGSPGFYAYKMYRNADDKGHGFGDFAVAAHSPDAGKVTIYGSLEKATGLPVVMILNKLPSQTAKITLELQGKKSVTGADVYRYDGSDLKAIQSLPGIVLTGGKVELNLPPYSITLLRCK